MKFSREWAMPSHETFSIRPMANLLGRYMKFGMVVVDPFARDSRLTEFSNDQNSGTAANFHLEAAKFLDLLIDAEVKADLVLFDPPYSPRQISEHYKSLGLPCTTQTTQNSKFRSDILGRADRLVVPGGRIICCGWCSSGLDTKGYEFEEIMLISHGSGHNDTIVTVQRKQRGLFA